MGEYSLVGCVIDARCNVVVGWDVFVFRATEIKEPEHPLASAKTDAQGRFDIALPESELKSIWEKLGRAPRVFLILKDPQGQVAATTKPAPLDFQLEFRIFLGGGAAVPDAAELYGDTMVRLMAGSRDAGVMSQVQGSMLKIQTPDGQVDKAAGRHLRDFLESTEATDDGMNQMSSMMDGFLTNMLDETPFKQTGYDGPQVPKTSWAEPDNQVIIWPRKEPFRWA